MHVFYIIFIFFISGCGHLISPSIDTVHSKNPLLNTINKTIDFKNIKTGHIDEATIVILNEADSILKSILSINQNERTFSNTVLKLDDMYNTISNVWNVIELISATHPYEGLQLEADQNDLKITEYMIEISLHDSLYNVLLHYSNSKDAKDLSGGRKRFLESELRDFKRSGLNLSASKRKELRDIQINLSKLGIAFSNNIDSYEDTLFITEDMTRGLPEDYKNQHLQSEGRYAIDLSYPSYDPFIKYAESDSLRKIIRYKYLNVASPENLSILEEIIFYSDKMSKMLGYPTYAAYSIEESMAKTPLAVWEFENSLRRKVKEKASIDIDQLKIMKKKRTNREDVEIHDWEKYYYEDQLLLSLYQVNSEKVKEYFELTNVMNGFYIITEMLFGLTYKEIESPSVWHPDVTMYEMYDKETGNLMGTFYLDLFPRSNKYQHAAEFSIISGKDMGKVYQLPVVSLVCNFPKPTDKYPSLLSHEDVETYFHEFGHLIHDLLSRTELMSQSGTSVAMDFVEAPSQVLENWVWNKESLQLFATHYLTGEVIPDTLIERMILARNIQSGNDVLQQIFYGMLDLTLYDSYEPNGSMSISEIVKQLQNTITNFRFIENTHQEASFDHLLDYSASYYGYLWSEVYAKDMYSVFEKGGVLNPSIGQHYRKTILEKGGSEDPMDMVINFLGRKPNNKAFYKSMGVK